MENKNNYAYALDGNLYLNLTNRCCNSCDFCIRLNSEGITGNKLWLDREPQLNEVIDQIEKLEKETNSSFKEAIFCGYGEPTYVLDLMIKVAEYLRLKDKKIRLNTNGLGNLINGKNIVPIIKDKIDEVSVSVNEGDSKKYNALCHPVFENAYSALWEFVNLCVSADIKTTVSAVDVIGSQSINKIKQLADKAGATLRVRAHISDNLNYK